MMQMSFLPSDQPKNKEYTGSVIYEPRGRAGEYAGLACNLYTGCDHGCIYCYAPSVLHKIRAEFHEHVTPRADIIKKLERDILGYAQAGDYRQVLLCFTCDPYSQADLQYQITRKALETFRAHDYPFCVLTKGGSRALRDIDLFTSRDAFACTLTCLDDVMSREWEPNAALPSDRIYALHAFHERGIQTWVSIEPVLDPAIALEIIRLSAPFVDKFKVGVLNYHPRAKEIDWRKFAQDAKALLESLGKHYLLKQDLARYL